MAEIGRIIRIKTSFYMAIPRPISDAVEMRAGDRMAIITDGRTIAAAKIPIHDIVNRAMLRQAVRETGVDRVHTERAPANVGRISAAARAVGEVE